MCRPAPPVPFADDAGQKTTGGCTDQYDAQRRGGKEDAASHASVCKENKTIDSPADQHGGDEDRCKSPRKISRFRVKGESHYKRKQELAGQREQQGYCRKGECCKHSAAKRGKPHLPLPCRPCKQCARSAENEIIHQGVIQ